MRKVDCECKHTYENHTTNCNSCICTEYDPAGHNPELYNILCPQCRKVRLEKAYARTYECPVCHYIMFERQVKEALNETL